MKCNLPIVSGETVDSSDTGGNTDRLCNAGGITTVCGVGRVSVERPAERTRAAVLGALLLVLSATVAAGQDNTAQEASHRAAALARLPADAAQRLFGLEATPAAAPARPIGEYVKGCLAGGVALPADGPNWEVMRPSRNRAWGHPSLIGFIERVAAKLPAEAGWPGLLVGDIAQPRGGPMLTGHASHQIGLDADIWLRPMPGRRLDRRERETMSATDVVAADGNGVDPAAWTPQHAALLKAIAKEPQVARIFVNPAIKRELCAEAGADRGWLAKIRPWWGHSYHFHIRLRCPPGAAECRGQAPPAAGDGCGKSLAWWFTREGRHPPPSHPRPLLLADLPPACAALVAMPAPIVPARDRAR